MTTLQSTQPLTRLTARLGNERLRSVALSADLLLDPPYQRGSVWGRTRQRNLIRSLLLGLPIGDIFINVRPWPATEEAVIDGRQRLEAIRAFLTGNLDVPASWFPTRALASTHETSDGPYVTFDELAPIGQGMVERCPLSVQRLELDTQEQEAAVFDLVNFGGLAQGQVDDDRTDPSVTAS